MEPHPDSRAEAERWLAIAEKLLAGGDLVGSRTFAIRARESEPRLEATDQILAVADTLIAGENRINNQHDWYAILRLAPNTCDPEMIANQYRRLAILLNPQSNRFPFADQAIKLVSDAWLVLSNPSKKSLYDNELILFSKLDHRQNYRQEQQRAARRNPRKSNNYNRDKNVSEESEIHNNHDGDSTFWTTCPYCYYMYEYPGVYEGCALLCQNCQRAIHGTKIPAPPSIVERKEAYVFGWGFFPLGVSISDWEKNKAGASSWNPFSPMFTCPWFVDKMNAAEDDVNVGVPKNVKARKSSAPRIYIDDDDIYVEVTDSSEESDDDWGSTRQKKKAKNVRGKSSIGKNTKKSQGDKANNVNKGGGDNPQGGSVMQEAMGASNVSNAEISRNAAAHSSKKQTGKAPKERGKLDLNVEFSNEVEEPAPGMSRGSAAGNGEEDGIEGTGFFEGLDEFLSSLPILNVVDDKVKAA